MLTWKVPILARVFGTRKKDYYVPPGDPIGFRHMCWAATMALTGGSCAMEPLDPPVAVEVFIIPAAGMTEELREMIRRAQKCEEVSSEEILTH